jgi:preprotein translocase subunit SecG
MTTFLTVLHVFVCVFLILVVLLQAGKGGGMGIAFGGGGGSQTVFGSSGAGNFLTKLTSVTAFIFLVTSLGLAHYSSQQDSKRLQRLAERKTEEKKVEDERAVKLKADLDKAREAAKKTDAPAKASELPVGAAAAMPTPKDGEKAAAKDSTKDSAKDSASVPKALGKKDKAAEAAPAAAVPTDGTAAPVKPKKKRRAAPPVEGAAGESPAAPAAPAEAPAAPSQ